MTNSGGAYGSIPAFILDDDDLDHGAVRLYGIIAQLASNEGRCWADNKHFIDRLKVDERTIQRWLTELKDKEYIIVDLDRRPGQGTSRTIWIENSFKKQFTKRHACHPPPGTNVTPPRHPCRFLIYRE